MLHHVQGGLLRQGLRQARPAAQPEHAYGYFDHVPCAGFKGGHVTCGGVIYDADAYPKEFRGSYIAGNLLSNAVYWYSLTPDGSSFKSKHAGELLEARDSWFRPVDCLVGPDGCVYVADWYDRRAAHLDPVDSWDKTNGRVYRISYKGTKPAKPFDLRKKTNAELVELLKHPNTWWRREARQLLADRDAKDAIPALAKLTAEKGPVAIEATWSLHQLGGIDAALTDALLKHEGEHVRAWAVRFLGDSGKASTEQRKTLAAMAEKDASPTVRSQLACSANRLPASDGLPIAFALAERKEDERDPHLPLLVWWAVERHVAGATKQVLEGLPAGTKAEPRLLERTARRIAAVGTEEAYQFLNDLLARFPNTDAKNAIVRGVDAGSAGRDFPVRSAVLEKFANANFINSFDLDRPEVYVSWRLMARIGKPLSRALVLSAAIASLDRKEIPSGLRVRAAALLADVPVPYGVVPDLVKAFERVEDDAVRSAILTVMQRFAGPVVASAVAKAYPGLKGEPRIKARALLLSRFDSAKAFVADVVAGKLPKADLSIDQLRPLLVYKDAELTKMIETNWGKIGPITPGEKKARIDALGMALARGPGDAAKGKAIFAKSCAVCHTLHGDGGKVGPDLTAADRKNRGYMLTQIVDPSGYIRPEFMTHIVETKDGRTLTGLVAESSAEGVTLVAVADGKAVKTVVAKSAIDDIRPSAVSLMPEKLLDALSDQDVCDLFAFLVTDPEPKPKGGGAKKLKVLLVSGSLEYKSDESLSAWGKHLEEKYPVEVLKAFRKADDDVPGLDQLETCDAAVFFTRRLTIKGEQLEAVKKYAASGKPVVGVRTASHGFQNWLEMDQEVFGGDYRNHYGAGPKCEITLAGAKSPVLAGVEPFASAGSLYKNPKPADDVTVVLRGKSAGHDEPVAWTRAGKKGRVFYTSLGHPDDFQDANFVRLLDNALFWTLDRERTEK